MPRGQFADAATKLRAIAELDNGADLVELAARLNVNPKTIQSWKKVFDEGGLLEDMRAADASADDDKADAPTPPPAPAPSSDATGGLKLADGSELPAISPQRDNAARRVFDDDFKYLVGRALLARRTKISHVAEHYNISRGLVRDWADRVQQKTIKPSAALRARERAATGAPTTNGHAAPAARATRAAAAPTQQLTIEGITPPMETTQLVPYAPPVPPQAKEVAELFMRLDRAESEVTRLKLENDRLKAQLRTAFDMVLSSAAP